MDAPELSRWTRFAAKGGIGKCSAAQDCVAEKPDDLMFLEGDEIIVLMQLPDLDDIYLGYCEGVVGRFSGKHVRIHGKLKKPVMTKRASSRPPSTNSMLSSATARSPPPPSPRAFDTPSPGPSSHTPGYGTVAPASSPADTVVHRSMSPMQRSSSDVTGLRARANVISPAPAPLSLAPTTSVPALTPATLSTISSSSSVQTIGSRPRSNSKVFARPSSRTLFSSIDPQVVPLRSASPASSFVPASSRSSITRSHSAHASSSSSISRIPRYTPPPHRYTPEPPSEPSVPQLPTHVRADTRESMYSPVSTPSPEPGLEPSALRAAASMNSLRESMPPISALIPESTSSHSGSRRGSARLSSTEQSYHQAQAEPRIHSRSSQLSRPSVSDYQPSRTPSPMSGLRTPSVLSHASSHFSENDYDMLGPARPPGIPPGPLPGGRYTPVEHMEEVDSPIDPSQRLSSATSFSGPATPSLMPLSPSPSARESASSTPHALDMPSDGGANVVPKRGASLAAMQSKSSTAANGQPSTPSTDSDSDFEDDFSPDAADFTMIPQPLAPPEVSIAAASPTSPSHHNVPNISVASSADTSGVPDSPDPHASHLRRLMPQRRSQLRVTAYRDSTYDESDRNSRLRFSAVEDNGFAGIGFSLLQNFVGGNGRDSMSTVETGASSDLDDDHPEGRDTDMDRTLHIGDPEPGDVGLARRDTVSSTASSEAGLPFSRPPSLGDSQEPRQRSPSLASMNGSHHERDPVDHHEQNDDQAPLGNGHARAGSIAPSLGSQSDGMSIYDNYRYSVYSTTSKFSRASFGSLADAPPIPEIPSNVSIGELGSRPSIDRQGSAASVPGLAIRSRKNSDLRIAVPPSTNMTVPQMPVIQPLTPRSKSKDDSTATSSGSRSEETQATAKENLKSRPAPLQLAAPAASIGEGSPSPLLHTTFGSPLSTAFTDMSARESTASAYSGKLSEDQHSAGLKSPTPGLELATSSLRAQPEYDGESLSPAPSDMSISPNLDDFPQPATFGNGLTPSPEPNEQSSARLDADHIRPQFRSKGVQEVAGEVEARFSRASRASSTIGEGLPTRQVDAEREPLPKIQVDSVHVSHMVFPAETSPGSDIQSAVSPYPISALPTFGASFHPHSPTETMAYHDSPLASPRSPNIPVPDSPTPGSPLSPSSHFGNRQSLFMPHPNAPQARPRPGAGEEAGPMYGRKSAAFLDSTPVPPVGPMTGTAVHAMHLARGLAFALPAPGMPMRRSPPTIYALTSIDLSESTGPVPVTFSLEPPNAVPAQRLAVQRAMTADAVISVPYSTGLAPSASVNGSASFGSPTSAPSRLPEVNVIDATPPQSKVLPRGDFQPKPRPRSRSFSAVERPVALPAPAMPDRPADDSSSSLGSSSSSTNDPFAIPSVGGQPRPRAASGSGPSRSSSARPVVNAGRPSPLSLPQNNTVVGRTSPVPPVDSTSPPHSSLRQVASSIQLRKRDTISPPTSPNKLRAPIGRRTISDASKPQASFSSSTRSISDQHRPSGSFSSDTDGSETRSITSPPALRGSFMSSPAHSRTGSVRSKLSMSALRPSVPPTPTDELGGFDIVQVKDADFELVPPRLGTMSARGSIDSSAMENEPEVLRTDNLQIKSQGPPSNLSRPLSPASTKSSQKAVDDEKASAESHRQRELRWVQLLAATPAGQLRRSKKAQKLLLEGVPASVRAVVWANLVDVPARRMPGVYEKLGGRGRVPASAQIQRDLALLFPGRPAFWESTGSLATLLQAYLTMVPDVHYHSGLALIAGYLLDQGPEEDAFWTFASVMDMHLRGYFAASAIQLEVDAALFSKGLESNEPALVKKLFVQLQLQPVKVCEPWFTSIFANALPTDYMVRVWDLFLLDGPVFLIRVGLALATCARSQLLQCTDARRALALLSRPPADGLPADADAFIALAMGIRMRDEDVLKQRAKMEARLRATARPATSRLSGLGSLGISLRRG